MSKLSGNLEVVLISAEGLRDASIFGSQDPYCILKCGDVIQRSQTHIDGGQNPIWNARFEFPNVAANQCLHLLFANENMFWPDNPIGHCSLHLFKAAIRHNIDYCIPILTEVKDKFGNEIAEGKAHVSLIFHAEAQADWIFSIYARKHFLDAYHVEDVLFKDATGKLFCAMNMKTGEKVIAKRVEKKKTLVEKADIERFRLESLIMRLVSCSPGILKLKGDGVYEDANYVYFAREYCDFLKLSDVIERKAVFKGDQVAYLMRGLLMAVRDCHSLNVILRDLKPANILLTTSEPRTFKILDLSAAMIVRQGCKVANPVATTCISAPEMLKGEYGREADIWACGVIMYALLSGNLPFTGLRESTLKKTIMEKDPDYESDAWHGVSSNAIDCVKRLLERDPAKRASVDDILNHKWMKSKEKEKGQSGMTQELLLCRTREYAQMHKLKQKARAMIAGHLLPHEAYGFMELFASIEADGDGHIDADEYIWALKQRGCTVKEEALKELFRKVSHGGMLAYEDFVAIVLHPYAATKKEAIAKVFRKMDADKDRILSREDLMQGLVEPHDDPRKVWEGIDQLLQKLDPENDGLNLAKFEAFMCNDKM